MPPFVHTAGHSDLSPGAFLRMLHRHGIRGVADVRRLPRSRRWPHFGADRLRALLAAEGLEWRHFPGLGGLRAPAPRSPHRALAEDGLRAYADHMDTEAFADALGRLEVWAAAVPVVVMCAERDPARCHRRFLADALLRDGFRVLHVFPGRGPVEHVLQPEARLDGRRIVYDAGVLPFEDDGSAAP